MKKGFTLIELLAVIVVIGIVATITTINVAKVIRDDRQSAYNTQISFIEKKAKEWSIIHDQEIIDTYYLTIQTLIDDGFIDNDKLINPITGADLTGCVKISSDLDGAYEYKYGDYSDCGTKIYYVDTPTYMVNINHVNIGPNSYVTGTTLENKYCIDSPGSAYNTCIFGLKDYIFDTEEACEEANSNYNKDTFDSYECNFYSSVEVDNGKYVSNYKAIKKAVFLKIKVNETNILNTSICFVHDKNLKCIPVTDGDEYLSYNLESLKTIADDYREYTDNGISGLELNLSDSTDKINISGTSNEGSGLFIKGNSGYSDTGYKIYRDSCEIRGNKYMGNYPGFEIGTFQCIYE